ncbi:MAG: HD domain-containing protein [Candidatus Nanoarchaeia archaeon]
MDEKKALGILKKYAPDVRAYRIILRHSRAVQCYAVWLARRVGKNRVDIEFVSNAALLHDIGRYWYPPGKNSDLHGVKGAAVLKKEGLLAYALVCERHLGVGITRADIKKQNLRLPLKDYVPKTIEEKIVSYADLRMKYDKIVPIQQVARRFEKEIGYGMGQRVLRMHKEIQKLYKR